MSNVIKSDSSRLFGSVRRLEDVRQIGPVARPVPESEADVLRKRVAALEARAQQQDELAGTLKAGAHQARLDGEKIGYAKGLAAAQDQQTARLKALEGGIEVALADLNHSLASLERLAVLVARDCLHTMLGDPAQRMDMLSDMVRLQMSRIERGALLGIDVSCEDFPAAEDLAKLARRIDPQLVGLFSSIDMPAGACVIRLKLGQIHAGVDQQWGALDQLLCEMASPEPA